MHTRSLIHPARAYRLAVLGAFAWWVSACNMDLGDPVDDGHDHDHDQHDESGPCGHIEANGTVLESHGTILASEWAGLVQGQLTTRAGTLLHGVQVIFLRPDSTRFAVPDSCAENQLIWSIADSNVAQVSRDPGFEWTFNVFGKQIGTTTLTLQGWHEDHLHRTIGPIPVAITGPP